MFIGYKYMIQNKL